MKVTLLNSEQLFPLRCHVRSETFGRRNFITQKVCPTGNFRDTLSDILFLGGKKDG